MVAHAGVDKVAFTGSTEVGSRSSARSPAPGKRLTLELGGKAANIVYDDAALDQAVEGVVEGIFFNQGHVCCAGSRLLVQESVADELIELLRAGSPRCGWATRWTRTPTSARSTRAAQLDKIVDLAAAGDAEGARRWTSPCPLPERGLFFPPTVFSEVEQSMRVAREEIFGPVLSVLTFRTPARGHREGEQHPHGLSAGVWTDKGAKALWTARRLRAGVVWTNTFNRFDPTSPFGGYGRVRLRPGGRPRGPGRLPRRLTADRGWRAARPA